MTLFHSIVCQAPITFDPTFPDANGIYHTTNAIHLERKHLGEAGGSVSMTREIESFEAEDVQSLICDFILGDLRELCQANIEYDSLAKIVGDLKLDQSHIWTC